MRGKRNTDRNVRKFITVSDEDKWEMIDKLMTLPRYEKSFGFLRVKKGRKKTIKTVEAR